VSGCVAQRNISHPQNLKCPKVPRQSEPKFLALSAR